MQPLTMAVTMNGNDNKNNHTILHSLIHDFQRHASHLDHIIHPNNGQYNNNRSNHQLPLYTLHNTTSLINTSYHRRQHCNHPHTRCPHHHRAILTISPRPPTFLQQPSPIVLHVTSHAFTPILALTHASTPPLPHQ